MDKLSHEYREYKILKQNIKDLTKAFYKPLLEKKSFLKHELKNKTKDTIKIQDLKTGIKTLRREIKEKVKQFKSEQNKTLKEIKKENNAYKKEVKSFFLLKKIKIKKQLLSLENDYKQQKKNVKELYISKYKNMNQGIRTRLKNFFLYQKTKLHLWRSHIFEKNIIVPSKLRQLKTLIKLNLSDKISSVFLKYNFIRSLIFYIAGMGLASYFVFTALSAFKFILQLPIEPGQPFVNLLLFFIVIISTISASFTLSTHLYEDKHNKILLPLPLSKNLVYASKIISAFIIELKKSLMIYFSLLMGYGMCFKLVTAIYFFKVLFLSLLLPLVTILLGQLISIIIFFVRLILNKIPLFNFIIGGIIIYLTIFLIDKGIASILRQGQVVTLYNLFIGLHRVFVYEFGKYVKFSFFARHSLNFLFGYRSIKNLNELLILVSFTILFLAFSYLNSFLYYKIYNISSGHGVKLKKIRLFKNIPAIKTPIFLNYLNKEFKEMIRDKKQISIMIAYVAIMPLLFYFLNKFFLILQLSSYGKRVVLISQIFLGLLLLTSANVLSSSIISREGDVSYLLKSSPRNVIFLILAKFFIILFITISAIVFSFILNIRSRLFRQNDIIVMHIIFILGSIIHMLWSSEFDIFKPYDKEFAETNVLDNNKNVSRAISLGIIFSIFVGFLCFILSGIGRMVNFYLFIVVGFLSILLIYRCIMVLLKTNTYIRWAQ